MAIYKNSYPFGSIVRSGLVLNLDATNLASYPGTGTTWFDTSGNGNNGTFISGAYNDMVRGRSSVVFDGVDDYISCGNSSSLDIRNEITLLAWINGVYTIEHSVLDKGGTAGHHFGVYGQKIIFQTSIGYKQSNTTLLSNVWYNIGAVYDKVNVRFYLNGVADGTQALTGGLNAPTDSVWIGRYTSGQPLPFSGKISIAQMYNRALTAAEVQQNFNALRNRFGI